MVIFSAGFRFFQETSYSNSQWVVFLFKDSFIGIKHILDRQERRLDLGETLFLKYGLKIIGRDVGEGDGPVGIEKDNGRLLAAQDGFHSVQGVGHLDRPLAAGVNTVTAVDAAGVGDGSAILLHLDGVNRTDPDTGITFLAEGFVGRNDLHVVTLTLIKSIAFIFRVHKPG